MTEVRRISGLVPSVICHLSFAICHLPSSTRNTMLYRGAHHDVPWGRRRLDRPRGVFKSRRQVKMGFVIRPFRETDRAAVIALAVAAFFLELRSIPRTAMTLAIPDAGRLLLRRTRHSWSERCDP